MLRLRSVLSILMLSMAAPCADAPANAPIVPRTVCEILQDLASHDKNAVAALGRYSFRQDGRWLSEQACDGNQPAPPVLWLTEDAKEGPRAPDDFELDGIALGRKFTDLRKRTSLGKFRFGSPDYDRWAVVYGRLQSRNGEAAKKAQAELVFRGDGVVIFLTP